MQRSMRPAPRKHDSHLHITFAFLPVMYVVPQFHHMIWPMQYDNNARHIVNDRRHVRSVLKLNYTFPKEHYYEDSRTRTQGNRTEHHNTCVKRSRLDPYLPRDLSEPQIRHPPYACQAVLAPERVWSQLLLHLSSSFLALSSVGRILHGPFHQVR